MQNYLKHIQRDAGFIRHAAWIPRRLESHLYHNIARSEEHTSELQSQSTNSYAVFFLKKKKKKKEQNAAADFAVLVGQGGAGAVLHLKVEADGQGGAA